MATRVPALGPLLCLGRVNFTAPLQGAQGFSGWLSPGFTRGYFHLAPPGRGGAHLHVAKMTMMRARA
jgi:hypothetical protein